MKSCFILMPFSSVSCNNKKLDGDDLDFIYKDILYKAVSEYSKSNERYFSEISRYESKVGSIIDGIVKKLNEADLVIADLTGLNPNVMYELGVRHALKRGTIILSQDLSNLPSDLRDYMTVGYKYSDSTKEQAKNYLEFKHDLHKTIDEVLDSDKGDSPVLSYLGRKWLYRDESEIDQLKDDLAVCKDLFQEYKQIADMIQYIYSNSSDKIDDAVYMEFISLKLDIFCSALNQISFDLSSPSFYELVLNVKSLLDRLSKNFIFDDIMPDILPDLINSLSNDELNIRMDADIKKCIEKSIINTFSVIQDNKISFTNALKLFCGEKGIIKTEFLKKLEEKIEEYASDIGMTKNEIKEFLAS